MVIYENNFPQFLESIAIGPDPSFLEKNTTNCEFVSAFPEEIDLIYTLKDVKRSSDPLNHMRHFVKKVCIFGPDLDTPTLNHMVKSYDNFPPYHKDIINIEIGLAFNKARKLAKSSTNCNSAYRLLGVRIPLNIPIPDDLNFICKLADGLRGCKKPCNYFKKSGDSMGILSDFMRGMSTNSNVLGDITSDVIHAPLNIATNVYNKINPIIRKEFVALSISSERLVKEGVAPFFPKETKKKIVESVNKGRTTDKIRSLLGGDMKTYHAVSKTSSSVVSKIQQYLGDCFRKYDHNVRYNPYDPMYNSAYSKKTLIGFKNGNVSSFVDLNGYLAPNQFVSDNTFDKALNSKSDAIARKNPDSYTPRNYNTYNNPNAGGEKIVRAGDPIPQDEPNGGKTYTFDYGEVKLTRYGYAGDTTPDIGSSLGLGNKSNALIPLKSIAVAPEVIQKGMVKSGDILILTCTDRNGITFKERRQVADISSSGLLTGKFKFLIDEYTPNKNAYKSNLADRSNQLKITITVSDAREPLTPWSPTIVSDYAAVFTNKSEWYSVRNAVNSSSTYKSYGPKMDTDYIKYVQWT